MMQKPLPLKAKSSRACAVQTSLGQLNQHERERMYSFLTGIPWEELFEDEDGKPEHKAK